MKVTKKIILIATTEDHDVEAIDRCFAGQYTIRRTRDKASFISSLRRHHPEISFIDIRLVLEERRSLPQQEHKKEIDAFWEASSSGPIIILTPQELLREAVKMVKAGASNYLGTPMDPAEVSFVTESMEEFERFQMELDYLRDHFWKVDALETVQTRSPLMRQTLEKIQLVAPARTTVLITGETGVGKSTLAKLLHQHSERADRQFIYVPCGAIVDNLVESELFGHEKGAFTGAVRRKRGKFEVANGGTIFLDEVGALTPAAQIKLLGVLQERCFQRVGGEADIHVDVRIIAATNIDMKALCEQGVFRQDLYYRLNVFPLEIPTLRERREDIPLLVKSFIRRLRKQYPKPIEEVSPEVLEALMSYHWPGNVRELENILERAFILEQMPILTPASFPAELFCQNKTSATNTVDTRLSLARLRHQAVEHVERQYLEALLQQTRGRIRETAQVAGIGVRQLHKLLTRYKLDKRLFRRNEQGVRRPSMLQ